MGRSPNLSLRVAAAHIEPTISCGANSFADHVAAAMKRSTSPDTGSEREPHPIETAPRDGRFLILKEDASGKFNIARWAPEAGEWVRENDQPIKISPAYWYPIPEQNDFQPGLDTSTSPPEPERRAAPLQPANDVLAPPSDAAPCIVMAAKIGPTAVEPKRATTQNRFAAFSIVASLVMAISAGMYFRGEVTSAGDLFGIGSGQVIGQVTQWLSRNLENQVSPASSQDQHGPRVDASAQIAELQHEANVGGGAEASGTTPAEPAMLREPAAIDPEHSPGPAERERAATLASELVMVRREAETMAALLRKATGEAAQLKQTVEATAAELRQSLALERDRVAALAGELATARRGLVTEVALSAKAGEEAEQLRQAAKATTEEQERNSSATPARDPESAQRMEAPSTTQRLASSPIIDNAVAEQLRRSYRAIPKDKGPRRDLYARAYEGGIKAAKDRSKASVNVVSDRKPATWFGREAADH